MVKSEMVKPFDSPRTAHYSCFRAHVPDRVERKRAHREARESCINSQRLLRGLNGSSPWILEASLGAIALPETATV